MRVEVCSLDELDEDVPRVVRAGDRRVALVRTRGQVFAIRDRCPHMSTSFAGAVVDHRATGTVGRVVYEEVPLIMCPWHTYEYELETGRCVADPSLRVRTYAVEITHGRVYVDLDARRGQAGGRVSSSGSV